MLFSVLLQKLSSTHVKWKICSSQIVKLSLQILCYPYIPEIETEYICILPLIEVKKKNSGNTLRNVYIIQETKHLFQNNIENDYRFYR